MNTTSSNIFASRSPNLSHKQVSNDHHYFLITILEDLQLGKDNKCGAQESGLISGELANTIIDGLYFYEQVKINWIHDCLFHLFLF